MNEFTGRLYRERRQDGSLGYPTPVPAAMIIHQVLDERRFIEQTPLGLAVRYLVPLENERLYPAARSGRPGPGLCEGLIVSMAPDFDAPLEDLKEYME